MSKKKHKKNRDRSSSHGKSNKTAKISSETNQSTLVSLAILKSQLDGGKDYLEQLRPFILHVLCNDGLDRITDASVAESIAKHFGLIIPARTTQLVLRRIARDGGLVRSDAIYRQTSELPYVNLESVAATAVRHINALVAGLTDYAKGIGHEYPDDDHAIRAICDFLTAFGVDSLRAILRGTALPDSTSGKTNNYIVGAYIRSIQESNPERFESLSILAQGHMLANALVCPDLANAPPTFRDLVFYIDTPLLVQALGLEGEPLRDAALELFRLLSILGGRTAVFEHIRDELEGVIQGAAEFIDSNEGRGGIIREARRSGVTKSDLLLVAARLNDKLQDMEVRLLPTPKYENSLQIDEAAFANMLTDRINNYREKARQHDINSVRSIYVLRRGRAPRSLERAIAVLVTTNAALVRAASIYGRNHEESREVSSTITAFSLANLAWLKAPMQAPHLPTKELLSVAYAAMRPTEQFLDRALAEAEKLQAQGGISERDIQVLRSNLRAQDSLMELTLGDDDALNEETVTETLRRVTDEIRREESDKLEVEVVKHQATREQLSLKSDELEGISRAAWERSVCWGNRAAWTISILAFALIIAGIVFGLGLKKGGTPNWVLVIGAAVVAILTILNLLFGTTVRDIHCGIYNKIAAWAWRVEQRRAGGTLISPVMQK